MTDPTNHPANHQHTTSHYILIVTFCNSMTRTVTYVLHVVRTHLRAFNKQFYNFQRPGFLLWIFQANFQRSLRTLYTDCM